MLFIQVPKELCNEANALRLRFPGSIQSPMSARQCVYTDTVFTCAIHECVHYSASDHRRNRVNSERPLSRIRTTDQAESVRDITVHVFTPMKDQTMNCREIECCVPVGIEFHKVTRWVLQTVARSWARIVESFFNVFRRTIRIEYRSARK